MKRTAVILMLLALRLFAGGGTAGCGSGNLGGNGGGEPPIGGNTGIAQGNGGDIATIGSGGVIGTAGVIGTGGVFGTGGVMGRAGTGGVMGRAGTGGTFSFGGTYGGTGTGGVGGTISCQDPSPPVCGARCGNGFIDVCTPTPAPGCPAVTVTEECDGLNATPLATCQSYGYMSGNLSCSAGCTMDYSGCRECAPLDSLLAACGPAPVSFPNAFAVAIAATDSDVAVALIDDDGQRLRFVRLSPSLALESSTLLDDPGSQVPTSNPIIQVGVAAIPSGWVVAVCRDHDVYIHAVDATATSIARTSLFHSNTDNDGCVSLSIAGRPGAGPLVIWQTNSGVNTAVVAADGRSIETTQTIGGYQSVPVNAAWAGGAFVAADPVLDASGFLTLDLIGVKPDGSYGLVRELLPGALFWSPAIDAGASDLRIAYSGLPAGGIFPNDQGVIWQRLGLAGELLSVPATIASGDAYAVARAVAIGDDTFVLLENLGQFGLAIAGVGLDGRIVTPLRDIVTGPLVYAGDMARCGSNLIVAWTSSSGLSLARLTP
jgi:hypothetical protein